LYAKLDKKSRLKEIISKYYSIYWKCDGAEGRI
jgi:hypothetical protein